MPSIKCGKCKSTHESVAEVKWCHNVVKPPEFTAPGEKLVVGSSSPAIYLNAPFSKKDEVKGMGARWDAGAKKWWITEEVKNLDPEYWEQFAIRENAEPAPEPVGEGWYRKGDKIFKVVLSKQGNPYAMVLVIRKSEDGLERGVWDYAPGMISDLRLEDLMSVENQCKYGKLYGICVRCGQRLTKQESQERGMGDICFGKAGI